MNDHERAVLDLLKVTIPGKPVPCPRPRVTRSGKPYYSESYKAWKDTAAWLLRDAVNVQRWQYAGPVRVKATFYQPHRSADGDNLIKSVLDAMQVAGVIANDNLVWRGEWEKVWEGEPRTEIEVSKHPQP